MIYFIQESGKGLVKIGCSGHPRSRLEQLSRSQPHEYTLLGTHEGGFAHEKALHEKFRHLNFKGEWFLPNQEIFDFIKTANKLVPEQQILEFNGFPEYVRCTQKNLHAMAGSIGMSMLDMALALGVSVDELGWIGKRSCSFRTIRYFNSRSNVKFSINGVENVHFLTKNLALTKARQMGIDLAEETKGNKKTSRDTWFFVQKFLEDKAKNVQACFVSEVARLLNVAVC